MAGVSIAVMQKNSTVSSADGVYWTGPSITVDMLRSLQPCLRHQLRQLASKNLGEAVEAVDGNVLLASLDLADIVAVNIDQLSQLFLADTHGVPAKPDGFSDLFPDLVGIKLSHS